MARRRDADSGGTGTTDVAHARLRRELEARGIDPVFVDAVLARLAPPGVALAAAAHAAIVDGVVAAYRAHQTGQENLRRSLRELAEMSRLMEDFAAELRKLDEALKTLAAYLERIHARVVPSARGTVH
jgi:hypothetical protein